RVAGVSSFGFSGTNAHLILEQAPAGSCVDAANGRAELPRRQVHLLNLSAKSEEALTEQAQRYERFLEQADSWTLDEICHTAAVRRSVLPYRLTVMGHTRDQLRARLAGMRCNQSTEGIYRRNAQRCASPIGFLFTGQGSQYPGMGKTLLAG